MDYKFMNEGLLNGITVIKEQHKKHDIAAFKMVDIMLSMTREYFGDNLKNEVYKERDSGSTVAGVVADWAEDEYLITFKVLNDVLVECSIKDPNGIYRPIATIKFNPNMSTSVIDFHGYTSAVRGDYSVMYVLSLEERKNLCDYYIALYNAIQHSFNLGLLGENFDK